MRAFSLSLPICRPGLLLALWLGLLSTAAAQAPDSLDRLGRQLRRHEQRDPHEKLFLHLDRPLYLSGETMWFSVYAADGTTARPLPLSSVAYVEVLDTKHQPVLQGKVALHDATGQGSFVLPASLPAGRYTVRAYTSWMRNFDPATYFHTTVTVVNTFTASGTAAKDSATTDVQFFPEGGNLVRGLRSRVAFKVTDRTGRGMAATGKVLNQRGTVVATFQTLHRGMGAFDFTPAAGSDVYTAVVTLPNGQPLTRPLPQAFELGYVLHLDPTDPAHLRLTVAASPARTETVYLLGHSRQQVALATRLNLVNGQGALTVDAGSLLDGVSHFTLFTGAQQPVCERLYFRPPTRALAVAARPDKPQYGPRAKVQLQVSAADQQTPLPANLSMAVYRLDSLNTTPLPGIDRVLWLTSELTGPVEDPDYYFTATNAAALEATDHLLLTQGWSRFRWEEVLAAKPLAFRPEPHGLVARAQLLQANGQPRANVNTFLASPSRLTRLGNALSNAEGLVEFELTDFTGPRDLVLQADPAQDSTSRLRLLDPFS
ncbi:MG2 domain-containing protein, partial [Hymenobacter agri]